MKKKICENSISWTFNYFYTSFVIFFTLPTSIMRLPLREFVEKFFHKIHRTTRPALILLCSTLLSEARIYPVRPAGASPASPRVTFAVKRHFTCGKNRKVLSLSAIECLGIRVVCVCVSCALS